MIRTFNSWIRASSLATLILRTKASRFFSFICLFVIFWIISLHHFTSHNEQRFVIKTEDANAVNDDGNDFYIEDMMANFWNLTEIDLKPVCSQNSTREIKDWKHKLSSSYQLELSKNCSEFKKYWKFPTLPSSEEEAEYPLAYAIMGQKNLVQTLRLFRAIYEPQNVYCLTWDSKGDNEYQTALEQMGSCFSNVLIPKIRRKVDWCGYNTLVECMDCMKMLRYSKKPWKYTQIFSWNDYPLKTNRELVQIMKILNGTTEISLCKPTAFATEKDSQIPKPILPGNLVLYKSAYSVTMPREFVTFVVDNKVAQELYLWFNNSFCPEEMYFSTLAHNSFLKAPGGFPGICLQFYNENDRAKRSISRYQLWEYINEDINLCKGTFVSASCVFGVDDVPNLKQQYALLAHKFYDDFEPAAMYCLEEWHYNKIAERTDITDDMIKYYSNLQSVRYHHLSDKEKEFYVCDKS